MTTVSIASGLPETPLLTSITRGTGISGQLRPEVVGPLYPATPGYPFNIDAFSSSLIPLGQYGDAGRDIITGPTQFSVGGSASRTLRLGERKNLDIRFDATNLLNHFAYTSYNMTFGTAQFGLPTGAVASAHLQHDREVPFLMSKRTILSTFLSWLMVASAQQTAAPPAATTPQIQQPARAGAKA